MQIYINGKFYPKENAKISVFDHGLLYGDGIFETLRTYNYEVFKIDEHVERLFHSAKSINLKIPLTKSKIKSSIISTVNKNKLNSAYIRVTVTRGTGDVGYTSKCIPNLIIIAKRFAPYPKSLYEKGVSVITYNAERFLPKVKSTNCLALVMAKVLAEKNNCFETILVDNNGYITEGTVSNIFFVKNKILYTPKGNLLEGITRGITIKIAKSFIKVKETKIKKAEIYSFDECFLTNTTAEIVPVIKIDNKNISKHPGGITKSLMWEFKKQKNAFLKNAFF